MNRVTILFFCLALGWVQVDSFTAQLNDLTFQAGMLGGIGGSNFLDPYLKVLPNHTDGINQPCQKVWCEMPTQRKSTPYNGYRFYDDNGLDSSYEEIGNEDDGDDSNGFWLDAPPDEILYMPPPPIPPSLAGFFANMHNDSLREFIISDDPVEGIRCNFCKLFADASYYPEDDTTSIFSAASKENESYASAFYLITFTGLFLFVFVLFFLIKYKK